mgnify:CR=1 FL=1
MKKILVCILFILGLLPTESKAQKIVVKSNLLYDATTTMNLGLEVALARKWISPSIIIHGSLMILV